MDSGQKQCSGQAADHGEPDGFAALPELASEAGVVLEGEIVRAAAGWAQVIWT